MQVVCLILSYSFLPNIFEMSFWKKARLKALLPYPKQKRSLAVAFVKQRDFVSYDI